MGNKIQLSKSRYCKGIQCSKILWMDMNMPSMAAPMDESVLETGQKVGDLARSYFGDYELVGYNSDKTSMLVETRKLLERSKGEVCNIAEASFCYDGFFCSVDILRVKDDTVSIVEVKSSTEVKNIYIDDIAFQYYVLTKCGIKVSDASVMHIDSGYVREGELNIHRLFRIVDLSKEVKDKFLEVERNIEYIRSSLDIGCESEKDIGIWCENPYKCQYFEYCSRHLPNPSVLDIMLSDEF